MSDSNALDDEMRYLRRLLGFEPDPLALDEGTAERLLAGQLHPADAPPEYRCAAMVLAAAAAPPRPEELAGEREAVAEFRAVTRSTPHRAGSRRPTVPTRFLSLKLAAAVAIAALSVAGVAGAATGTLPDAAQRVAHRILGVAGVPSADDHALRGGGASGGQSAGKPSSTSDHSPTGPDVTGAAKAGLCRAWAAGQGATNGGKADATAFKALADAAGGADQIAGFCADVLKPTHEPQGTPSGAGADHGQGQDSGQGQGQGSGQGQGNDGGQGSGQDNGHGAPPATTGPGAHG
jgi:hypothetical protein